MSTSYKAPPYMPYDYPGNSRPAGAVKHGEYDILSHIAKGQERHRTCCGAVEVLADIVTVPEGDLSLRSISVKVGCFVCRGGRISARLLGPTRIDGGFLLLTRNMKRRNPEHAVFLLDDLCEDLGRSTRWAYAPQTAALIEKALLKRDKILSKTTNYFGGTPNRVVEIL